VTRESARVRAPDASFSTRELSVVAPDIAELLTRRGMPTIESVGETVECDTVTMRMRDGASLVADVYKPTPLVGPGLIVRTPYGRRQSTVVAVAKAFKSLGYVVVVQDCRGTGDSEPDEWDYYVYEAEDSIDTVEWAAAQNWYSGFLASFGGSYSGLTQWCMALTGAMNAIAPEVAGFGVMATTRPSFHMFANAYSRSVGRGRPKSMTSLDELEAEMLGETLNSGYFNEPFAAPLSEEILDRYSELRQLTLADARARLYEIYAQSPPKERSEIIRVASNAHAVTLSEIEGLTRIFGHAINHDAHIRPRLRDEELIRRLCAPALVITGWYDWGLDDALATWTLLQRNGEKTVRDRSRLIITPQAHNKPGYHEGHDLHPELDRNFRTPDIVDLLVRWYDSVRTNHLGSWPKVIYYLMSANAWYEADSWPPLGAFEVTLYLDSDGALTEQQSETPRPPDQYRYDPANPTPTVGGSIVSSVYIPGSVDVSEVQRRDDVLTYTTKPFSSDFDVVGPMRAVLYASSSAVDTDFSVRLSDVFPDDRAIQIQHVTFRTRFRSSLGEPLPLEPGHVYRFEIDLIATANRFLKGHRLRLDISSADFPKFDRNTNLGGVEGHPIIAIQRVYHEARYPSHLILSTVNFDRAIPSSAQYG